MLAHQKLDELHVLGRNLVISTKLSHLHAAQLGVVTPTPFGNVVKEGCGIKNPRLVPARSQLGTKGVLVRVFHDKETPHVSEHHQNVLIHRVDMKEVVLHLPHNAPKDPQIPTQHRGLVHHAKRMGDALGFF